ncbi:MAG TPA: HAD-IC family P-type ATPase, partial [Gemmatimonadaceae bacterium]|nr:HAD-IC family P-type ATPase [Gemmatimonadaceae bacterium]
KGALLNVLEACTSAEGTGGVTLPLVQVRADIERRYVELSTQGYRTLGVAIRRMNARGPIDRDSEREMIFLGILAFADPPKPGIERAIAALAGLSVRLKVITGDNARVAARVGAQIGLVAPRVLTGAELRELSDQALPVRALQTDVFAEIEPNQKERIVRALRRAGHVVGYMGDGINDAPALHAADVSISVQEAVDVAKEAADIVLLEQDLTVLAAGVREGRKTFSNTLKYVFMATSANFGNMFSMAGASLLLSFLPLLPKQILLTNLLTDMPGLTIATDLVDSEWVERPRRWDVGFIRRFMLVFGLVSSLFDYVTFGVLLWVLDAGPAEFRTGWFVESVVSAALIVLVVRTRGRFWRSRPSSALLAATLFVVAATVALPYTPLAEPFEFVPLPPLFLGILGLIVLGYVSSAELAKNLFYKLRS